MSSCPVSTPKRTSKRSVHRGLLAVLGVVCVGLAALGVFVPGLPTTVFLIAASILFTKSCPWLEDRLIRVKLFRPYLHYIDGETPMPRRAKITAVALMWTAVVVSSGLLWRGGASPWLLGLIVLSAIVGTVVIVRLKPWRRPSSPGPAHSR